MHDDDSGEAVLDFWFGAIDHGFPREPRDGLWFGSAAETDRLIATRFGAQVERALDGGLAEWAATPRGALALVLLLDQFTRNVHRGSARAFAGDARARGLARQLLDAALAPIETVFALMPFEHSEALADQELCVAQMAALAERVPAERRAVLAGYVQFAEKHRDIIRRFGRFPHRNAVLGRESTPEEIAYLQSGASRFGQ